MNRGQSLFELIVALGIAAIVIVGLMRVATTSVANITFSQTQSQANRYAEAAMEWLRQERDEDWNKFYTERASDSPGTTWCLKDENLTSSSWSPNPCGDPCGTRCIGTTQFKREGKLIRSGTNQVTVAVTVSWDDSTGTHLVSLDSKLTNWRGQ